MTQKEIEAYLLQFLKRKYVQTADPRQKSMGLSYITAETQDLAKELAKEFIRLNQVR